MALTCSRESLCDGFSRKLLPQSARLLRAVRGCCPAIIKEPVNRIPLVLALTASLIPSHAAVPAKKPKLVLAVVIDQFRYDYRNRFRKDYSAGIARLSA